MVLHSFADDPAGRYYGPLSLRGSRMMRTTSSLDICPKVIGIDHPAKTLCVFLVDDFELDFCRNAFIIVSTFLQIPMGSISPWLASFKYMLDSFS